MIFNCALTTLRWRMVKVSPKASKVVCPNWQSSTWKKGNEVINPTASMLWIPYTVYLNAYQLVQPSLRTCISCRTSAVVFIHSNRHDIDHRMIGINQHASIDYRSGGTWYLLILKIKFATWLETCFIPFIWIFQKQDSPDRWTKLIDSFFWISTRLAWMLSRLGGDLSTKHRGTSSRSCCRSRSWGRHWSTQIWCLAIQFGRLSIEIIHLQSAGGDFSINGYHNSLWRWPTGCF